jgi:hypothetical protein
MKKGGRGSKEGFVFKNLRKKMKIKFNEQNTANEILATKNFVTLFNSSKRQE